jgi:hypothetical protein
MENTHQQKYKKIRIEVRARVSCEVEKEQESTARNFKENPEIFWNTLILD